MPEAKAPPITAPASPPEEPQYVPVDEAAEEEDAFTAYTQEELTQAEHDLKNMKPSDLIGLNQLLTQQEELLNAQTPMPEAGGIAFTAIAGEHGTVINVTCRARTGIQALDDVVATVKHARATYNLKPVKGSHRQTEPNRLPNQPAAQTTNGVASGTDVLNKIVVTSEKIEFHVGKFKWPFGDSRIKGASGPKIIADLFDPSLGWTEAHFKGAHEYTPKDWGNVTLFVDWEKPGKYYNVVKIHA